ncbi:hypothetical protein FHG87_011635 [Trinorchestia longiramus]|nr:hypothetical protein FHG87_011635 [Trinorchestia longiramus]
MEHQIHYTGAMDVRCQFGRALSILLPSISLAFYSRFLILMNDKLNISMLQKMIDYKSTVLKPSEPVKSICVNVAEFRDYCFVDQIQISNTSEVIIIKQWASERAIST